MNIEVFTCYHKQYPVPESDVIVPIHVGKARSSAMLDMQGDNEGSDHISHKNPYYCELTALYWAWKNSSADAIGLFHYRRFLNFKNNKSKVVSDLNNLGQKFNINKENIQKLLKHNDIILPQKAKRSLPLYDNYASRHISSDLDLVIEIIEKDYPAMIPVSKKVLKQNLGYFSNMLIAHKNIFHEYCEWLFDILFKVEAQIHSDVINRESYQQRVYGFLSERLLTIFIEYKKQTSNIKIAEVPVIFVDEKRSAYQVLHTENKVRHYLFGVQFYKTLTKQNKTTYYLFGIPIFRKSK